MRLHELDTWHLTITKLVRHSCLMLDTSSAFRALVLDVVRLLRGSESVEPQVLDQLAAIGVVWAYSFVVTMRPGVIGGLLRRS